MKWPSQITIVRHGQSEYNALKARKAADPLYARFRKAYDINHRSPLTVEMARRIHEKYSLSCGDHDTPLTPEGWAMSKATGEQLKVHPEMCLPDVILVSPYVRTQQTLEGLRQGWPELKDVPTVLEARIREQEHGLAILYNDWRVFHCFHPEQKELRDRAGAYWYTYPQGENVPNVQDRARSITGTIIREFDGKRVMLVTHHLFLLALRANWERWTPEQFVHVDETEKPINCGVTIYKGNPRLGRDGKLVLRTYNLCLYDTLGV